MLSTEIRSLRPLKSKRRQTGLRFDTSTVWDNHRRYDQRRIQELQLGLFNPRRLKARTKVSYVLIRELLYADDCAFACLSEEDPQRLMDCFARSAVRFRLTISIKKSEVLLQPKLGTIPTVPAVKVGQNRLKAVYEFCYLESTVSSN